MNLSDFIEANLQALIDDWMEYALRIGPKDKQLTDLQLRDKARDLLLQIAADMRGSQTAEQQIAKSHGDLRDPGSGFATVARQHADERVSHGFDINDVVAEFRALRASVLRRWCRTNLDGGSSLSEMTRFNEAIDEALAESVRQHAQRIERIRDLFAGMLAHDLRSPLGAIMNSAAMLQRDNSLSPPASRSAANVQRSATRMKRMLDDLWIFTRTRLGDVLPVQIAPHDMCVMCNETVDEVSTAYPEASIHLHTSGDFTGKWDGARIRQLLVNLLSNAVQHGSGDIAVDVTGDDDVMTVIVTNGGNPIPADALPTLFDPLTRTRSPQLSHDGSMGLGLYICRSIAQAHGGDITVESVDGRTAFTVTIPRDGSDDLRR
jgi:signal transduction histidine kinase